MIPVSDEGRPFTEEEIIKIRAILEKEERIVWFWSTMRVWAGWVVGIVGAYFAIKSLFADVLARMTK